MGPMLPMPGTPAYEEFIRKARNPASIEGQMLKQIIADSTTQTQQQVRGMLMHMIEIVPGQLFRDIERFHKKFGLEPTKDPGHKLDPEMLNFRIKFLVEELLEYVTACGWTLTIEKKPAISSGEQRKWLTLERNCEVEFDAEEAFDGLIDLVVVALGTAYLHRFSFNDGWNRVQAANMAKEKSTGADDPRSKRHSANDIVKPEGWQKPVLVDLLDEECGACHGVGDHGDLSMEPAICGKCGGKGTVKRARPSGDGQQG